MEKECSKLLAKAIAEEAEKVINYYDKRRHLINEMIDKKINDKEWPDLCSTLLDSLEEVEITEGLRALAKVTGVLAGFYMKSRQQRENYFQATREVAEWATTLEPDEWTEIVEKKK